MRRNLLAPLATVALAGLLLVGCTGGEDPVEDPTGTGTTAPTGSTEGTVGTDQPTETEAAGPATMPAAVDEELAALDPETFEVLGSATAELDYTAAPVTVEGLAVVRHEGGLDLTFRLSPGEDISSSIKFAQQFSLDGRSAEVSGVRLVSGKEFVRPLVYRADPKWDIEDSRCLCSKVPRKLGTEGIVLRASFPDFDDATRTVSVSFPGFEDIEDVPVQ